MGKSSVLYFDVNCLFLMFCYFYDDDLPNVLTLKLVCEGLEVLECLLTVCVADRAAGNVPCSRLRCKQHKQHGTCASPPLGCSPLLARSLGFFPFCCFTTWNYVD